MVQSPTTSSVCVSFNMVQSLTTSSLCQCCLAEILCCRQQHGLLHTLRLDESITVMVHGHILLVKQQKVLTSLSIWMHSHRSVTLGRVSLSSPTSRDACTPSTSPGMTWRWNDTSERTNASHIFITKFFVCFVFVFHRLLHPEHSYSRDVSCRVPYWVCGWGLSEAS